MIDSEGTALPVTDAPIQDVKSLFSKTKKKIKSTNVQSLPSPPVPPPVVYSGSSISTKSEGWEQEYCRLDKTLRSQGLRIEKVDSDGSCLFSAFAVHFPGCSAQMLRQEAVEYMLRKREDFEPFVDLEIYPLGFRDYCSRMLLPQTWGGQLEIQALSQAREVNVYVFQTGAKSTIKMINFDPATAKLVTVSYHDGEHYNSIVSVESTDFLTVDAIEIALMEPVINSSYIDDNAKPVKQKKKSLFN